MKQLSIMILLAFSMTCYCQNNNIPVAIKESKSNSKPKIIMVDSLHVSISTLDEDLLRYLTGLIDTHSIFNNPNPCTGPSGYTTRRNNDGKVIFSGNYHCNKKVGPWMYYFPTGKISKIENYIAPYSDELETKYESVGIFDLKNNKSLLEGPYIEFYENGNTKLIGEFTIAEEFSTTDSLLTFDFKNYEEVIRVAKGEFWLPKSIKTGYWTYFTEDGELISNEYFDKSDWKDRKIRSIDSRFWEALKVKDDMLLKEEKE